MSDHSSTDPTMITMHSNFTLNIDMATEAQQLRQEVSALKDLLKTFQQTQQLQYEALSTVLEGRKLETTQKRISAPPPARNASTSKRQSGTRGPTEEELSEEQRETQAYLELWGEDEEWLFNKLKQEQENIFENELEDKAAALKRIIDVGFFRVDSEDDLYRVSQFLLRASPSNHQAEITVRDFYDMRIRKLLEITVDNDNDLWELLSRKRSQGNVMWFDTNTADGAEPVPEDINYDKIQGHKGSNENGGGKYPAYGREIIVNQLTPNITTMILAVAVASGGENCNQPYSALDDALREYLSEEPQSMSALDCQYKNQSYVFTATFYELVRDSEDDRVCPIVIEDNPGDFGSNLWGVFAPTMEDSPTIRETTVAIVFHTVETPNGTYWTIISIGEYTDGEAFNVPFDIKLEEMPRYSTPQEVFLDKLARIIDFASDDGMADVLAELDTYINIPASTLFSKEDSEKLLFDDTRFTRTKKYHWAMQWLSRMERTMKKLISAIEDFEEKSVHQLRAAAQGHRIRIKHHNIGQELVTEKSFTRKADRARKVYERIKAKQEEIKDLRDSLVNASAVLDSRAAVSSADTVYILTVLMIVYLPVTTVIGVFGMDILPESSQSLKAFGIAMGSVVLATTLLGLNLSSVITVSGGAAQRFSAKIQDSMIRLGGNWEVRSNDLKDFTEAENLIIREKRIPVAWYYTWYLILWAFMVFPAQELRKVGGILTLTSLKSDKVGPWVWDMAFVPLRVVLLPVHGLLLCFDYIFLVLFGVTAIGQDPTSPPPNEEVVSDAASGKKHEALLITPVEQLKQGVWTNRFTQPISTIMSLSVDPRYAREEKKAGVEETAQSKAEETVLAKEIYDSIDAFKAAARDAIVNGDEGGSDSEEDGAGEGEGDTGSAGYGGGGGDGDDGDEDEWEDEGEGGEDDDKNEDGGYSGGDEEEVEEGRGRSSPGILGKIRGTKESVKDLEKGI